MVNFSFSISSLAFTSPTFLASSRSDKSLIAYDSNSRRALQNPFAHSPPREAIEDQRYVQCEGSGTESVVPRVVDRFVEDSRVSESSIDGQMSFGGNGGKLQAGFKIPDEKKHCSLTNEDLDGSKPTTLPKRKSLRRGIIAVLIASAIIKPAEAFDFGLVAPDQTIEEAESVIREDASALLQVKALIDSESWSDARNLARKRAAYLKRDIYTIIQGKPRSERPILRKLYFDLFINVSRLDFAARDEDGSVVLQCYDNIVTALTDILSRI